MKKHVFIIKQLFPISEKSQAKILAKFEFYAESIEDAEKFKDSLSQLFSNSAPIKTSPRDEYMISLDEEITEI
jgi:hypothetical protein